MTTKRRITRAVELSTNKDDPFTVGSYIYGLSRSSGYRRSGISGSSFAKPREMYAQDKAAAMEAWPEIAASRGLDCRTVSTRHGIPMPHYLGELIDRVTHVMPYLQVFPSLTFHQREHMSRGIPNDGIRSVALMHESDDFPVGILSYNMGRYELYSPLTVEKRNGMHYSEDIDRMVSLARKYFKYRTPPRIAGYVAFDQVANTDFENPAYKACMKFLEVRNSFTNFGPDKDTARAAYFHLRTLHNDGEDLGPLNEVFDEFDEYKAEYQKYKALASKLMYARMINGNRVSYAFYDGNVDGGDFRGQAIRYGARYDNVSPVYEDKLEDMPPEFTVKISQLALEESGNIVEELGLKLNQYEYVMYAEDLAKLDDAGDESDCP